MVISITYLNVLPLFSLHGILMSLNSYIRYRKDKDDLKHYDNFASRLRRYKALLFATRVAEISFWLSVCALPLESCDVIPLLAALASWEGFGFPPRMKMMAPISNMCPTKYVDL